MRKLILSLTVLALLVGAALLASSGGAASNTFSLGFANVDELQVGSVLELGTRDVPAGAQGLACIVTTTNGESVHTGASMTFASGGSSTTLAGTEETSNRVTVGAITLGATVHVTAIVGQDPDYAPGLGGFSMDAAVFTCTTPETTTTTRPAPTAPPAVVIPPGFTG